MMFQSVCCTRKKVSEFKTVHVHFHTPADFLKRFDDRLPSSQRKKFIYYTESCIVRRGGPYNIRHFLTMLAPYPTTYRLQRRAQYREVRCRQTCHL